MIGDLVNAANLLRTAVAEAAQVMMKCPHCQAKGKGAALQVWQALDAYEPAIATLYTALNMQPGVQHRHSGVN
jgi:hypothetical protein